MWYQKINLFNFIITILEIIAVVNALQLEATRTTPVLSHLITTPCLCWSRWTYSLPYYSSFASDTLLCAETLTFDPVTLTFDLEHLQCIDCDVIKLYTKFERNRAICSSFVAISIFDLMTLNAMYCVALGSEIIFIKFDHRQLIRAWIIAFLDADTLSRCDLDLWAVDLDSSWYIKHQVGCVAQLAERRSLPGELNVSCTRPAADGWPLCE